MIDLEVGPAGLLVVGALMLFWVGMLGLLWRRSLVGMLVGLLFAWISVALAGIGFSALRGTIDARALGGVLGGRRRVATATPSARPRHRQARCSTFAMP